MYLNWTVYARIVILMILHAKYWYYVINTFPIMTMHAIYTLCSSTSTYYEVLHY